MSLIKNFKIFGSHLRDTFSVSQKVLHSISVSRKVSLETEKSASRDAFRCETLFERQIQAPESVRLPEECVSIECVSHPLRDT